MESSIVKHYDHTFTEMISHKTNKKSLLISIPLKLQ